MSPSKVEEKAVCAKDPPNARLWITLQLMGARPSMKNTETVQQTHGRYHGAPCSEHNWPGHQPSLGKICFFSLFLKSWEPMRICEIPGHFSRALSFLALLRCYARCSLQWDLKWRCSHLISSKVVPFLNDYDGNNLSIRCRVWISYLHSCGGRQFKSRGIPRQDDKLIGPSSGSLLTDCPPA